MQNSQCFYHVTMGGGGGVPSSYTYKYIFIKTKHLCKDTQGFGKKSGRHPEGIWMGMDRKTFFSPQSFCPF